MNEEVEANRQIRRLAKLFADMIDTQAWKEYERVIEAQIETRTRLVFAPIADLPGTDLQAKFMSLESIKGALIGLRLALDLPSSTMKHAADISREEADTDNG